jgi:phosphohistidine swiveling domain-containing protein
MPQRERRPAPVAEQIRAPQPADLIRDLADVGEDDAGLVGGKAYPLAMLMRRGFSVPKGFCITSEAFRLAGGCDAKQITLPAFLRELIVAAWRRAGMAVAAVRSSAAEEDGRAASWAGIFPTELGVEDEQALLAAVERCFRAVHAPEAALYRSRAASEDRPAMAVLVQEMVDAETAGMVFSSNPVSGARDEIVINAVHGLGCALAAGTVTGDTFVVGRDGAIKRQNVSPKPFRTTRHGEIAVRRELWEIPAVCQQSAIVLARMAVQIEEMFGCPQDIEFAVAHHCIHILQARPITALRNTDELKAYVKRERRRLEQRVRMLRRAGKLRGGDVVFSNGNIGELLPTPTPMSFGIFREIFAGHGGAIVAGRRALGYQLADDSADGLYELICGQPYFNLEVDAGTFNTGVALEIDEIIRQVQQEPARANYPEFGLYQQALEANHGEPGRNAAAGRLREIGHRFHASMATAGQTVVNRFSREIEPALRKAVAEARQELDTASELPELVEAVGRRIERLKRGSCVPFVIAARLGFFFAEMVRWRLTEHIGDAMLMPQLLQGLEGSRITDQALELERLASGKITRKAFLESYGHLAANELEISLPRFLEDPSALDCLLNDLAASGRCPGEDFLHQQRRRRAAEAELQESLTRVRISQGDADELQVELRLAQALLPLRETIKYYYAAEYAVIRSLLLRLNGALGWQPDDIFYLLPEEIPQCTAAVTRLKRRIALRRREHKLARRMARQHELPAVVFGSRLHEIGARPELPAVERLAGTPVASGLAIGIVRLYDCADGVAALNNMRGDEIIVSRSANLGLAPVMRMAAGLIVEVGGVLAHAACQARESGIPAVVLPNASLLLRDGMKVRLDGDTGTVELLQQHRSPQDDNA